jgi:hypothetical protein
MLHCFNKDFVGQDLFIIIQPDVIDRRTKTLPVEGAEIN